MNLRWSYNEVKMSLQYITMHYNARTTHKWLTITKGAVGPPSYQDMVAAGRNLCWGRSESDLETIHKKE